MMRWSGKSRLVVKENSVLSEFVVTETIIFLSYILICTALFKRRFSLRATVFALGAAAAVIAGVQAALILSGEEMFAVTMLPLTAYLPFSVLLYFLSDCGVFETAAVCSVGMLEVLILKTLNKVLNDCFTILKIVKYASNATTLTVITVAAAGFVFIAFRFIGKAFRFCVIENRQNRLLLSVPIIFIFLLIFYFLNSTTDIFVLILTLLISLSIFLIIAKLLSSAAELIKVRRSEKELSEHIDIQRRSYERVLRKIELGREYRHDMRHHLTVIEGLAKQGNCDKVIEYTRKMDGSLGETENVSYCKSPELNAVLSEYISRAENAGCRITHNIVLPEKLPFEEDDLCIVLANSVENAINACVKLPEQQRYINILAECTDQHRLLVSVKNPCGEQIVFDDSGLPVVDEHSQYSDEHGIGLRSVNRITEKYNGFLRCKLENGEFVFQAVLFYEENAPKDNRSRMGSIPKRAVSSLLGLGLGTLIVLNILPSAAEAASSLLSVNIRTIRSFILSWGDSSISMEYPEVGGNGAEEINNAVTNYTDEAREKFLWYFDRRYNGYVGEDMRYTVIRDDERYFIAQFNVTINAGGSMDYSRWIVFDKSAEKVLELGDLFKEGSDYIGVISDEILRQMKDKNENEGGGFFIEGDDAFTEISGDANFYIDSFDRLVIVFDEYEVAPGYMGSPQFYIKQQVLEEIAR